MEALDNKCPACCAKIDFNPANQMWDCRYCGSKFTLEQMQQYNNASSVEANSIEQENGSQEIDIYCCNNCGAEIMADVTTTATFCVYCGSTAILKEKINEGRAPDYIIPFKNVKDDAVAAFKKIVKSKPLAPRCFKDAKIIEKITGVYIPFWAYDLTVYGPIEFLCTDVERWSEKGGSYKKMSKYEVKKSGKFEFNKVLADASSRFSNDLMDSLEPFDYTQLTKYNHAYLSGFLAEKYDVDENTGLDRVKDKTFNTAVGLLLNSIRHQKKEIVNNQMTLEKKNTYYIMLPVWMLNIKYKDKNYTFAMNGQTGKIIGDIPIGIKETIIWSIIIFIILFVVAFLGLKYL